MTRPILNIGSTIWKGTVQDAKKTSCNRPPDLFVICIHIKVLVMSVSHEILRKKEFLGLRTICTSASLSVYEE